MKDRKTIEVSTPAEWRRWLAGHHDSEKEIWLIFYKRHTKRPSISYADAVDEALCFGWIDSLVKRIDESRYARKFTPRLSDSAWSTPNRERYARLLAMGRLTPAGVRRAPTERSGDAPRRDSVPRYILRALSDHAVAANRFDKLPPSHRRNYIGWVDSAKQTETKIRRLSQLVSSLSAGRKLELK